MQWFETPVKAILNVCGNRTERRVNAIHRFLSNIYITGLKGVNLIETHKLFCPEDERIQSLL